jgi:hypothetical protein
LNSKLPNSSNKLMAPRPNLTSRSDTLG